MALGTAPLLECFRDGTSPKVLSLVRPAGTPGRPSGLPPAGPQAHLALAQRALTSLSLMSSQRRSCSICRSRSLISAMAHPPARVRVGAAAPSAPHRGLLGKAKASPPIRGPMRGGDDDSILGPPPSPHGGPGPSASRCPGRTPPPTPVEPRGPALRTVA